MCLAVVCFLEVVFICIDAKLLKLKLNRILTQSLVLVRETELLA